MTLERRAYFIRNDKRQVVPRTGSLRLAGVLLWYLLVPRAADVKKDGPRIIPEIIKTTGGRKGVLPERNASLLRPESFPCHLIRIRSCSNYQIKKL